MSAPGLPDPVCRWCAAPAEVVLDLGEQPAADHFPHAEDPLPDPVHPLRMALCPACGLAQLAEDATVPDEPRGVEPLALREQAADAVARLVAAGVLRAGDAVVEFGSPHGGSWEEPLAGAGLHWRAATTGPAPDTHVPADVVVDVFGLMHDDDQRAALARREAALRPGGVLVVVVHSLAAILRQGQWNALRHGHFAYYSVPALLTMLTSAGWVAVGLEAFELYGGTVALVARRAGDPGATQAEEVTREARAEQDAGVLDPAELGVLQARASEHMAALRAHLDAAAAAGRTVVGYGAASRAVALLAGAGAGPELLAAVVDASPAKQGRALPGTRTPVVGPEVLRVDPPDEVLLFVADLLAEVRAANPAVEAAGGRWVVVDLMTERG